VFGVGHGRATIGTGRAGFFGTWCGQVRHGPCQGSGVLGTNFFFLVFLNRARTITYKTT